MRAESFVTRFSFAGASVAVCRNPRMRFHDAGHAGCVGIAGRVTSTDGPSDVWKPTGTRGVERVESTPESEEPRES